MYEEDLRDEATYDAARREERLWLRARDLGVSRRRLLQMMAAAGAGALLSACTTRVESPGGGSSAPTTASGTGPAPAAGGAAPSGGQTPAQGVAPAPGAAAAPAPKDKGIVKPVPPEKFIDYGSNQEMRWNQMYNRGYVVPNDLFFVRNHSKTPRIDPATWKLRVEGSGVSRPLELTYDELLALPAVSVIRFVECAGNGRGFFEQRYGKKAQGTQWKLGAIGVAEWTGVPLREVLERAGIKRTARDVMPEGLDDLKVRRPLPVAKALEDDTLLVFAMNGEPLPPDHGFPVRLLVPGWIGVANTKWVGRIEVSEEPLFSPWNTESYVLIGPDYKPEGKAKGPALTTQVVKSALELAWPAELPAGRHTVRGRSWSGHGRIRKVEYSLDGGKSWLPARLQEPNIPLAWVRWDFEWDAKPGEYEIRVRATDEKGNAQPDSVPWNDQGYLYGAVVGHPVKVG
ncbi:sulfite oxidase [Caldinitratiruptor microaerophilus]|uniref:Sulfite oxidase n=1 Tax=Caldinitratiruptor microaerophilus TaxID=671077 RepID=A0AA35CQN2_9FIRM|nr:sulfite oxidase [Caldinitratiruptor microaerophilus]BDG62035.1 sulfite oxidase [Caldinitratiruptor microaerophilus]